MKLAITRLQNETWRNCAIRYAKLHGLEVEVAEAYDNEVAAGTEESEAAFNVCYNWDITDLRTDMD